MISPKPPCPRFLVIDAEGHEVLRIDHISNIPVRRSKYPVLKSDQGALFFVRSSLEVLGDEEITGLSAQNEVCHALEQQVVRLVQGLSLAASSSPEPSATYALRMLTSSARGQSAADSSSMLHFVPAVVRTVESTVPRLEQTNPVHIHAYQLATFVGGPGPQRLGELLTDSAANA
jgi:hypothetical protein